MLVLEKKIKITVTIICALAVILGSFVAGVFTNRFVNNKKANESIPMKMSAEKYNIFDSYKSVLLENDMCSYYMLDMDEDETPELILDKRTTNSVGYPVRVLNLYTFTEDKGAVKFGEINGCNFESSLYKIENEKDLFVYILNYDDNRGGYQQLINRYHKNETELSVSTFLDKYYESWCLELEENCFSCEYKSLTASNNKVESYFSLLSDTVRDKVNPYLDYSQFGIYDTSDFNYNSNSTGKYLSVNREDLFNLGTGAENSESFINNILGYFHCDCPIDYYGKNSSAEDLIRRIIGEGAYGETYTYYFGDFTTIKYSEKHDPLNMFSEATGTDFGSTGEYYAIPAENIRWIMKNIFNNTDWVNSYKVDEESFKCYLLNGTFYAEHIDFDGGDYSHYQIKSITDNENGTYDVCCVDNMLYEYDIIDMTVALKNIDGERRWTLIKLEK